MSTLNTDLQDRILALLGKGLSPALVASATSCDPSYISQLMSNDAFVEQVQILRAARLQAESETSDQVSRLHKTALDQLETVLPTVMDPMKLTRIFSELDKAKQKSSTVTPPTQITNNIVNLALPEHVARRFVLNAQREVIAVEGTELISMASNKVLELSKKRQEAHERGKQLVAAGDFNGIKLEEL